MNSGEDSEYKKNAWLYVQKSNSRIINPLLPEFFFS